MAFKFFIVSIQDEGEAEAELNAFVRSHKVLSVEKRWVEQGANSFWSFCIDYLETAKGSNAGHGTSKFKNKTDYKEILNPEEFVVYALLRDLRKEIAQAEAVPVYTIFTNEQLAKMVKMRPLSQADLEKIEGIGDARREKYGDRVLELLKKAWKNNDEAGGTSP